MFGGIGSFAFGFCGAYGEYGNSQQHNKAMLHTKEADLPLMNRSAKILQKIPDQWADAIQ